MDDTCLLKDTVVFRDGDYAIVESVRIFGTGWNVYRASTPGGDEFIKINERMTCFTSIEAAKGWLDGYLAATA